MQLSDFKHGQQVTYVPKRGPAERGIVKSVNHKFVFVVYKCGANWEHFDRYTAAATDPKDLIHGWHDQADVAASD